MENVENASSDSEVPQTPAGPGLFVMGNTTGLPQQQRARGRIRRPSDAGSTSNGTGEGTERERENSSREQEGIMVATTGEDRRDANSDVEATAKSSLLDSNHSKSPHRREREAETLETVWGKLRDFCMCRNRKCGGVCNRLAAVIVCIFVALSFMAVVGSIVAASLSELQHGKLEQYRQRYVKLENETAAYVTKTFHTNGVALVHGLLGADVLSSAVKDLLDFMASFSTSMLLVLVLLAFMLGTRKRRGNIETGDESSMATWKRLCSCCPFLDKDSLERDRMAEQKRRALHMQVIKNMTLEERITTTTIKYVSLKTKICLGASILVWISLVALGLPLAGMIALVSFILNYIPNFGPIIATLLPIPIALLDDSISEATGIFAVIIPALIHMIVGNVIEPVLFMQDEEIDMHPVVLISCIIVWYTIWGVPGAILAVPITTLMRIVAVQVSENNPENSLAFVVKCILEGKMPDSSAMQGRNVKSTSMGKNMSNDFSGKESLTQAFQFVLLCIALGYLLVYLKEVTIPYIVALFLLFLFSPLADATERNMRSCCRCCSCCDEIVEGSDAERDFV